MKSMKIWIGAVCLGFASSGVFAGGSAADAVEVLDAWVREMPPVSKTSAAYMTLKNTGDGSHALVSARSPTAAAVEIHTHLRGDDGVHRMREVERIDLPPGEETLLQPGGHHLMLIDLSGPLKAGSQVELTLVYGDGSEEATSAEVRSAEATVTTHDHHHH